MTGPQFDGGRYKAGQRQQWDAVAEAWKKWWALIEGGAHQASDELAKLAGVAPGQRVLDISTGIGEPAVTFAGIVGPSGSVVATDQSPGMLAIAADRIREAGLGNVELVETDTEALDLPEAEFDAVVCRWGLMFLPDLHEALTRICRALKPGGKFPTAVWNTPDKVPFISLPLGVAQRVLDPPPPPPPADAPNLFKLGAPGAIEAAFDRAGFNGVQSEGLTLAFDFGTPEQYVDFIRDTVPPIRALVSQRSQEEQDAFWAAIVAGARGLAGADGKAILQGETLSAVGTK